MPQISPDYWENLVAVILGFAILALIIERALYQIFDSRLWRHLEEWLAKQVGGEFLDPKPWIAALVSIVIVVKFRLDMIAMIFRRAQPQLLSMIVTGLFVAGGSTGIYKFFKRARQLKQKTLEEELKKSKTTDSG